MDLARHWEDGLCKAREIAASMDIPSGFVRTILSDLVAQGLLLSTAGPSGGYRLARPPEEITLLEIVDVDRNIESGDHSPAGRLHLEVTTREGIRQ